MNLIATPGWVLFNLAKTSYESKQNCSEFVRFYRYLIEQNYLQVHSLKPYLHRRFFNGQSLEYVAILAQKQADIPLPE
jgi:hypothetical protein